MLLCALKFYGDMKTEIKKGDVILCKSAFPTQEDLVINVETFGNGKIIDKNGAEYSRWINLFQQ